MVQADSDGAKRSRNKPVTAHSALARFGMKLAIAFFERRSRGRAAGTHPKPFLAGADMSEATRASQEAYRTTADTLQSKKDRLVEDANEVVRDIGSKVEANLQTARASLTKAQEAVTAQARYAADYTDQYVHENPWKSIGFAAVVGLLIGVLMSGRR
jgi:ElaB/YqjD/DUF883 family membrane-anchored ribosome-binding protein